MSNERDPFHPVCAGASRKWYKICPRCGAARQDNCGDDEAFKVQIMAIDPGWRPISDEAQNGQWWLLYENGFISSDQWDAEFGWWDIASEAEPTYYARMPSAPEEG